MGTNPAVCVFSTLEMRGKLEVSSCSDLWNRYWGQNKRQKAITTPVTILQANAQSSYVNWLIHVCTCM